MHRTFKKNTCYNSKRLHFRSLGSTRFIFSAENKTHINIDSILVLLSEKVKVTMFFSRNNLDVNIGIICLFFKILISQGLIWFLVLLSLNVPVNNFQSCRDGATASWVLPVLFGE